MENEEIKIPKVYLGDSVYARFDGYHIILTTENGYPDDPRNQIALEPSVCDGLFYYVNKIKTMMEKENSRG